MPVSSSCAQHPARGGRGFFNSLNDRVQGRRPASEAPLACVPWNPKLDPFLLYTTADELLHLVRALGSKPLGLHRAIPIHERLPQLNRALVHELATGRYLADRTPVLIVGPCEHAT